MFTAEQFNADTWAAMPTPIRSVWTRWLARLWNQRQLTRFLNTEVKGASESRLAGTLFCGGVNDAREIEGNAKLQEAYEMGKNV